MAWDHIIVGAGSAGCVLAHRLSANPRRKVLLLEGGGPDNSRLVRVPAGEIKAILNPTLSWMYTSEPDPTLDNRVAMWPGGKLLGGSSLINGMIYLRGQREDYDDWSRTLGNTGEWSYRDVPPFFKKMETSPFGATEYHGDDGPLVVSNVPTPHPLTRIFIESAQQVGIPFNPDVNGERQEGVGPHQGTVRHGRRNSTAQAYLKPARTRPNLQVVTDAKVDRVIFEGKRTIGVRFSQNGAVREERADGEVVVSAGAIASPALLMRSGIGPAGELSAHGIDVVHEAPGVGQNLQEHPVAWVSGYVSVSTYNRQLTPYHFVKHGLNWLILADGRLA